MLVTGVDSEGRSCVVRDEAPKFEQVGPGFGMASLFATPTSPPPPRPAGRADSIDVGVAPGLLRWDLIDYAPGATAAMHHTDSVDFEVILSGDLELILDDGPHSLAPGDIAVVTGVDHGWKAGPEGARMAVLIAGTPPPG